MQQQQQRSPVQIATDMERLPVRSTPCRALLESLYLTYLLLGVLLQMVVDFFTCNTPLSAERFDPEWVSKRVGKKCIAVEYDEDVLGDNLENGGAGGRGTARVWLTCKFADGTVRKAFLKKPTERFHERIFLTAFGVYHNEYTFYSSVLENPIFTEDAELAAKFVQPLVAWWKGTNFVLMLGDLSEKGAEFLHIIDPYPDDKVNLALGSYAHLHAHFWNRPPQNVWTDEFSSKLTVPRTKSRTRPRFLRLIANATLRQFLKKNGNMFQPEIMVGYRCFINSFIKVREYMSRPPLTACHGDAHIGNLWFTPNSCGFFDMQCFAAEHCMRDITYNLMSGCDSMQLRDNEEKYIRLYLQHLNGYLAKRNIEPLSFEAAWFQYRLQAWWAFTAFIISAGAQDLMDTRIGVITMNRITTALMRVNALGALYDVLSDNAP